MTEKEKTQLANLLVDAGAIRFGYFTTKSGRKSSSTAISNEIVVTASRLSCWSSWGSRAILQRKLVRARCPIETPFGRPVEPEEKIIYADCA